MFLSTTMSISMLSIGLVTIFVKMRQCWRDATKIFGLKNEWTGFVRLGAKWGWSGGMNGIGVRDDGEIECTMGLSLWICHCIADWIQCVIWNHVDVMFWQQMDF